MSAPLFATPPIPCPLISAMDCADWNSIHRAFRHAPVLKFDQSWREKRERGFRGGKVRIGWRNDRIYYFADLSDREVVTKARKPNDRMWMLGDVLEIFAGVHGRPGYLEYHTAPNGLPLQLFFPDAAALKKTSRPGGLNKLMLRDSAAVVHVRRVRTGWQVLGELPAASVWGRQPPGKSLAGQVWDVSFGRYDYPSGDGKPILSSTSPLTLPAYHRREEWRQIEFVQP